VVAAPGKDLFNLRLFNRREDELLVRADDVNAYVRRQDETNDEWTLESFRSQQSPGQFDPHFDPPSSVQ
jgi:hypothetical protein